jgi:phasin family protein
MAQDTKKDATDDADPFGDITKMLEQFKVPGVDMASIIDARRKDIEALIEANKAAYETMQSLARMQTDMLSEAMRELQEAAKDMATQGAAADPGKQAEAARKACQKVLINMKDIAEVARKSQADAVASMTERATKSMQEIKQMMLPV